MGQVYRRVSVLDEDGNTLVPVGAGAVHLDPFQVTTEPGVVGWQPYLMGPHDPPRFQFDRKTGRSEIGQVTVRVQDARVAGSNLERWASAFVGDLDGWDRLHGKTLKREIQINGSWSTEFSFIITSVRAPDPKSGGAVLELFAQDERILGRDQRIFNGAPHSSIDYAHGASVLPLGVPTTWGTGWGPAVPLEGVIAVRGISLGELGTFASVYGTIPREDSSRMTDALARLADAREWVPSLNATICDNARVWVKRLDTSDEGEFYLSSTPNLLAGTPYDGSDADSSPVFFHDGYVSRIGITPLRNTSHPDYMALPPDGTDVEFYVYNAGPPTADAPFLIGAVHPATLVRDILDGKFGAINDEFRDGWPTDRSDGSIALRPISYDETTFNLLEADLSFGQLRFELDRAWNLRDFLAEQVFRVCHIAGVIKGDGRTYLHDLRFRSDSATGAPTIDEDTIIDAEWEAGADLAPAINVTWYVDDLDVPDLPDAEAEPIAKVKTTRSIARPLPTVYASPKLRDFSDVNAVTIDALGARLVPAHLGTPSQIAEPYRQVFGTGAAYARLRVQYHATETQNVYPGDVRIVNADAIPNFAANRRGGLRLMQCVQRVARWPQLELRMLDLGPNTVALVPGLISVAQNASNPRSAIDVEIALNASGDPVELDIATTLTSVAIEPDEDSELWRNKGRFTAAGTYKIGGLSSGSRHWVRLRSIPPRKLPSAYDSNAFADTAVGAAIQSLNLTHQSDGTVLVEWESDGGTSGMRLYYEAHAFEDVPTMATFVDVDDLLGQHEFTSASVGVEFFTVEAEPYPTFSGGSVSGTPGPAVARSIGVAPRGGNFVQIQDLQWIAASNSSFPQGAVTPRVVCEVGADVQELRTMFVVAGTPSDDSSTFQTFDCRSLPGRYATFDLITIPLSADLATGTFTVTVRCFDQWNGSGGSLNGVGRRGVDKVSTVQPPAAVAITGGRLEHSGSTYAADRVRVDANKLKVSTDTDGAPLLSLTDMANYANDAAAATGGVPVGGLYRNGSSIHVRVS